MQEEEEAREGRLARAAADHNRLDGHRLCRRASMDCNFPGDLRLDDGEFHGRRFQKGRGREA